MTLEPGDSLCIPAHTEHWVTYTHPTLTTLWLAIHLGEAAGDQAGA